MSDIRAPVMQECEREHGGFACQGRLSGSHCSQRACCELRRGRQSGLDTEAASEATAAEIRTTERQRLDALVRGDVEEAAHFHADDFQLITPLGEALSKDDYLEAISSGGVDYESWEVVSPIDVRVYDESAVIRYRSKLRIAPGIEDTPWHTDVYERREGQWQVVWSHATSAGL